MSLMERKLNAVMRFIAAQDYASQEKARAEVRDFLTCVAPPVPDDPKQLTQKVLRDIGIPEHLKGYDRLVTAICAVIDKPDLINAITKELYPMVAKKHQDTKSRVERSIRHCIEVAWDRGDLDVIQIYFGNAVDPCKGRPTNGEFIARIANIVRQYAK